MPLLTVLSLMLVCSVCRAEAASVTLALAIQAQKATCVSPIDHSELDGSQSQSDEPNRFWRERSRKLSAVAEQRDLRERGSGCVVVVVIAEGVKPGGGQE